MNKKCVTFLVLISIILSMRVPIQIHASVVSEGYGSDSDLSYLKGMSKINQIYIKGCHMRNFESLGEMKYLTQVYLDNSGEMDKETIDEIDLNVFTQAGSLSMLFIQGLHIGDVEPISQLQNLKEIVFVGTEITDVRSLKKLENLQVLENYGYGIHNSFTDEAITFPHLKRLVIIDSIPSCYTL